MICGSVTRFFPSKRTVRLLVPPQQLRTLYRNCSQYFLPGFRPKICWEMVPEFWMKATCPRSGMTPLSWKGPAAVFRPTPLAGVVQARMLPYPGPAGAGLLSKLGLRTNAVTTLTVKSLTTVNPAESTTAILSVPRLTASTSKV